jgi:transcriptional regulator with XRE-family HTH domain
VKTITVEDFLRFDCGKYPEARIRAIAKHKKKWSALDILALEKDFPSDELLWVVLREKLLDDRTLHEFGIRRAERQLARIETPDPRSVAGLEVKRRWMRGEATDEEMDAAHEAARAAALDVHAAVRAAKAAGDTAAWIAAEDAEVAAWLAAITTWRNPKTAARAALSAWGVVVSGGSTKRIAAWVAEVTDQVAMLRAMLEAETVSFSVSLKRPGKEKRMNTFDKRLKSAATKAKLTQRALAEKTGIGDPLISMYFSGKAAPGKASGNLGKLAAALGVTEDYLRGTVPAAPGDAVLPMGRILAKDAAKCMGMSAWLLCKWMREDRFVPPLGTAGPGRGSRWVFHIDPPALIAHVGKETFDAYFFGG